MWRTIRVLVGFAALIGGALAASPLVTAEAQVGEYGPVEWLPVEGQTTLWCTTEAQSGCADRYHHDYFAMDISAGASTPIVAAGRGQVTFAITDQPENCPRLDLAYCRRIGREGNKVVITHADGVTSYYGHLSRVLVSEGDWVDETTLLGFGGDAGPAIGEHLHFEVRNGSGEALTFGSLRACDGARQITYPEAFGVATWNRAPAFAAQFTNSGAAACSAASGPTVISSGSTTGTGTVTVIGRTLGDVTIVSDPIDTVGETDQDPGTGAGVDPETTPRPTIVHLDSHDSEAVVQLDSAGRTVVLVGSPPDNPIADEQAPTTQPAAPPGPIESVTILVTAG